MNSLIELADRCERATGPDRELDEAIMAALFVREQRHIGCQEEQDDGSWVPVKDSVWVDPATDRWVGTGAREFTRSFDDAMTLVPKGWGFRADCGLGYGNAFTVGHVGENKLYDQPDGWGKAATPTLALCAAAIRAIDGARG